MKINIQKNKKILLAIVVFFAVCFIGILTYQFKDSVAVPNQSAAVLLAQETGNGYVPLTNGFPRDESEGGIANFLKLLFNWGIAIAVTLSIFMIIAGGLQYMTTDAVFGKEQGKERIKGAVAGLILALSAWIILYTINPEILNQSGRLFNVNYNEIFYV